MEDQKKEKESLVFESLTPTIVESIDIYENAINSVFLKDSVQNVAITGAYGAGKSSVLMTYEKKNPEKKFVHISLAHFHSSDRKEEITPEAILEEKILNQLVQRIPSKNIPKTIFNVKRVESKWQTVIHTLQLISFILSFLHILCFSKWVAFVGNLSVDAWYTKLVSWSAKSFAPLMSGSIVLVLSTFWCFYFLRTKKHNNMFRKLKLGNNEVEFSGEKNDESYFDKYLDEVLYLFTNIDADVVVFEDMDRFESIKIFERLREINTLVNSKPTQQEKSFKFLNWKWFMRFIQTKEHKPLRFFYLLRDDIFTSKDRIKFFDFIISIIPVIDGSNAYDQFIAHFEKNNLIQKFDKKFLKDISLYVDDMRLLKNVCNEFLIYYNKLNTTELDCNKMLAMIVYKNLFPGDFCKLQLNSGFIYGILSQKDILVAEKVTCLENEITKIEEEIQKLENEPLESLKELDAVLEDRKRVYSLRQYRVTDNDYIEDFKEWEQNEYPRRKKIIEDKRKNQFTVLQKQLQNKDKDMMLLSGRSLKELITRENIDAVFNLSREDNPGMDEYAEVKGSHYFDLLKYLIRNGYVDETYSDYMTHFYEKSLSRRDKIFLRSVADKKAKAYNYSLVDPEEVLTFLTINDFDQVETLNFSLLDYLLKTNPSSDWISHLVDQLKEQENFQFVKEYFDFAAAQPINHQLVWVEILNKQWSNLFHELRNNNVFDSTQLKQFSLLTLYHSADNVIKAVNMENCLTEYINSMENYLNIENPDIPKLIDAFKLLKVSFHQLDKDRSHPGLFAQVYEESLYDLNFHNIKLLLKHICNNQILESGINHRNYSILSDKKDTSLYKRINSRMDRYANIILKNCNGAIFDNEEAAIAMLNHSQVSMEQKKQYVDYLKTPISDIESIADKSLWSHLLQSNILEFSEQNIMSYFLYKGEYDEYLINFVNRGVGDLDFHGFSRPDRELLQNKTVVNNAIENRKYQQITKTLGIPYDDFGFINVRKDKMPILINNNVILMNPSPLIFVRENYPDHIYHFIRHNIDDYVQQMARGLFSLNELLLILSWDISDSLKIRLLKFTNAPISIIGKKYSLAVCKHILKHNLEEDDMFTLFQDYDNQVAEIQEMVAQYAIENVDKVIYNAANVTDSLKNLILNADDVDGANKVELFITMLRCSMPKEQACIYFDKLGLSKFKDIFDMHKRPQFDIDSDENIRLLDTVQAVGWISGYSEVIRRNKKYYSIRRDNHSKGDE